MIKFKGNICRIISENFDTVFTTQIMLNNINIYILQVKVVLGSKIQVY